MESDGDIEIRIEGSAEAHKITPELVYSDAYLDDQMRKAEPAWEAVPDPEAWLEEIRGVRPVARVCDPGLSAQES